MKTKEMAALGVLGAIVVLAATRKPKKRTTTTTPPTEPEPKRELEDEGVGYAEGQERNVRWSIYRVGEGYLWTWTAADDDELTSGDVPGFGSAEEAYANLVEEIDLLEHPKPPPPEQPPEGEGEPPPGEPPPPGVPLEEAPPLVPDAVSLFNAQVYPEDGDKSKLPALYDALGLIMSEDGTVAGVGPGWWDAVGERAETLFGQGVTDRDALISTLVDENFPPGQDPRHFAGLLALYNDLVNKIDTYLSTVSS